MYFLAWCLTEIWSQEIVCYICTEKLESYLAFIFSVIYRKWWTRYFTERRVNECIQGFICLGLFPPLFIEALVIAGSCASTKNMQKNLYFKLYAFCAERASLPWRKETVLGVRKVGCVSYWASKCFGDLRSSCQLSACPWARWWAEQR